MQSMSATALALLPFLTPLFAQSTTSSTHPSTTPQPSPAAPPFKKSTSLYLADFSFTPAEGGNEVPFFLSSNFTGRGPGSETMETITHPELDPTPRVPFIALQDTAPDGTTLVMIDPNKVGLWQMLFNSTGAGQVYAAPLEGESQFQFSLDQNGTLFTESAPKGMCGE